MAAEDSHDALVAKEFTVSKIWAAGAKAGDETAADITLSSDRFGASTTYFGKLSPSYGSIFVIRGRANDRGIIFNGGSALMDSGTVPSEVNTNAILDLTSTTKAFCIPRMTTAQETTLSAAIVSSGLGTYSGAMLFNTTRQKLRVWGDGGVTGFVDQT